MLTWLVSILAVGALSLIWSVCAAINWSCIGAGLKTGRFHSGIPLPIGTAAGVGAIALVVPWPWAWLLVPLAMSADLQFWLGLPTLIGGMASRQR